MVLGPREGTFRQERVQGRMIAKYGATFATLLSFPALFSPLLGHRWPDSVPPHRLQRGFNLTVADLPWFSDVAMTTRDVDGGVTMVLPWRGNSAQTNKIPAQVRQIQQKALSVFP